MTTNNNENNQGDDPARLLSKTVKIHSVTAKPELNGKLGIATSYLPDHNRYVVQVTVLHPPPTGNNNNNNNNNGNIQTNAGMASKKSVSLKPSNLQAATLAERIMDKAREGRQIASLLLSDPRLRHFVEEARGRIQSRLPPSVPAEYVLAGGVLILLYGVYRLGVSKFILLASLISILVAVVLPDIAGGVRDWKVLVRNFPRRWKAALVQTTGYEALSDRVSMLALVLLLLVCGKVLITSPASGGRVRVTTMEEEVVEREGGPFSIPPVRVSGVPDGIRSWTVEEIYKLGYEDGTKQVIATTGSESESESEEPISSYYGTSLPMGFESLGYFADPADVRRRRRTTNTNTDMPEWDYGYQEEEHERLQTPNPFETQPPQPPTPKSKFGIGTAFSLFAVGRAVKEMGFTGEGRFDSRLFLANLRMMEPWRIGLMALAVWRVVSAFC
jgi:hypothetical protein